MGKFIKAISVLLAVALISFVSFGFVIKSTQANGAIQVHIKTEVSIDNGQTWHSFTSSAGSSYATVPASPGGTIKVRVKVWNFGAADVINLTGTGSISNSEYVSEAALESADADGNSNYFTGFFFVGDGGGYISPVASGGSENSGYESLTAYLTLSDDIPAGTTEIVGNVAVNSYESITQRPYNLFAGRAMAQEAITSSFKIVVLNGLPQTGAQLN